MIRFLYIDLFCGAGGTSTGVEAARLHGEQVAIGKFHGMKLVQVWEFAPASELAFVSPVKWQDGLAFALAGRLRLAS